MAMTKDRQIAGTSLNFSLITEGGLAGLIATVPMTLFMLLMHRLLPKWQKYALPPEQITEELSERTGADEYLDKPRLLLATLVSHFGYGSSMGTIYGIVNKNVKLPLPGAAKGVIFGLLVWAMSYLGWLPAMEIQAAAADQPMRRNMLMIAAHIVWGAVMGTVTDVLER